MTTTKVKLAVSIDRHVADQLRDLVARREAASVSAFVEHAVRAQFAAEAEFDTMIEEMLAASGGPLTTEEQTEAARILGTDAA